MPASTTNGQHFTVYVAFSCPQRTLSTRACEVGGFSLLLEMSKLKPREVKGLAEVTKPGSSRAGTGAQVFLMPSFLFFHTMS